MSGWRNLVRRWTGHLFEDVERGSGDDVGALIGLGQQDPSSWPEDPGDLGDGELRSRRVDEDGTAGAHVERRVGEGKVLAIGHGDGEAAGLAARRAALAMVAETSMPIAPPAVPDMASRSTPVPQPMSSTRSSGPMSNDATNRSGRLVR